MGPRGAGKTLHGRTLAKKLGLFHIQFREYLQELVIAKTKKRVVSEREELQTAAEQDLPPEEPWVPVDVLCAWAFQPVSAVFSGYS